MKLIIAGANKLGEYLVNNYSQFGLRHDLYGFIDDDPKLHGKAIAGLPVLGSFDFALTVEKVAMVLALQNPAEKIDVVRRLLYHPAIDYPNLFSNRAWVSRDCIFGKGNLILEGSLINFGTLIGNFNTINQNCSIGHETVIGNFCYLDESVNFGGYSFLEDSCVIGKESVVSHGVRIGRETKVDPGIQINGDVLTETQLKKYPKPI